MTYRQTPPFSIQIELVEGCTLACSFCGVNGIREMPGGFRWMSVETASRVADRLSATGWTPRYEFAMHGEPSVHPELSGIVRIFREALGDRASMVMFSNGSGFMARWGLSEILEAGINTIGLDDYRHVRIVPRVLERYDGRYPVYRYPEQREHNLHTGRRVGHRDVVVIQDIEDAVEGNHATLNTHCGAGMEPIGLPITARCAKPFRELAIRWNGQIAICCNDFRGVFKIGSAVDSSLEELWLSERFEAARRKLYAGDRNFDPCRACSARSYRVGLLPDPKGRWILPPADADDDRAIAEATSGEPLTTPVLRRWETGTYRVNVVPDRVLR